MQASEKFLVGTLAPSLWCALTLFFLLILFCLRKSRNIELRNPPLLFSSGAYLACDFVVKCKLLVAPSSLRLCSLSYFSGSAKFTLHACAILLKALQYLVMTKDSYRRKFPRLKSNMLIFILYFMIFILNSVISSYLIWFDGTNINYCQMGTAGSIISFTWIAFLLSISIIISKQISWTFDSYGIGKDLFQWFCFTGIFGVFLICYQLARRFTDALPLRIEVILSMIYNIGAFIITTVIPIFKTVNKSRQRVHHYIEPDVYLVQSMQQCSSSGANCRQIQPRLQNMDLGEEAPSENVTPNSETGAPHNFLLVLENMIISRQPSIDKVLEYVFSDRANKDFFSDFCNRHFVPEISLFLNAVHLHKTYFEDGMLDESYGTIMSDFISLNSPYEINISCAERRHLLNFKDRTTILSMDEYHGIFDSICWTVFELFAANFLRYELMGIIH